MSHGAVVQKSRTSTIGSCGWVGSHGSIGLAIDNTICLFPQNSPVMIGLFLRKETCDLVYLHLQQQRVVKLQDGKDMAFVGSLKT